MASQPLHYLLSYLLTVPVQERDVAADADSLKPNDKVVCTPADVLGGGASAWGGRPAMHLGHPVPSPATYRIVPVAFPVP